MTIAAIVNSAVATSSKRRLADLQPTDRLEADLGIDGLDLLEIVMEIETATGCIIDDADYAAVVTVGDLIRVSEAAFTANAEDAA